MKSIFSPSGRKFLESLAFTRTLFAFDFDGTLSKIVPVPEHATMSEKSAALLKELSKLAPVALISGRSLSDLKDRVECHPQYLVGNHGLEGLGDRSKALGSAESLSKSWKASLETRFENDPETAGVLIEDKLYSIAVHYRACRSKKAAKKSILKAVTALNPAPRVILGKCVVNVLPSGAPHKGVAMLEIMQKAGTQAGFYIGDDDTDEDVFSLPNAPILSVRVGQKRSSQAQYYIPRQSDVNRLLDLIIRFHRKAS